MGEYKPSTYGDRIADIYDDLQSELSDPALVNDTVSALVELAHGGKALELGIGTGRIALPLAAKGVEVHGIDSSEAMVAKLQAKPGGADIPVAIGDLADVDVPDSYSLIYVVYNTFFVLPTQEEQVRCFRNVADHLTEDGVFVIEAFVPDHSRFDGGQEVRTIRADVDLVELAVSRHDPVAQRVDSQQVLIREDSIRLIPIRLRYAWPSELDLMARIAGLRLRERWENWERDPLTESSGEHISIYGRGW